MSLLPFLLSVSSDNRREMGHVQFPRGTSRDPNSQRVAIPGTHPAIFGAQPVDEYGILGQPPNPPTNGYPPGHFFPRTTSYLSIHHLRFMDGGSVSHPEGFHPPVTASR